MIIATPAPTAYGLFSSFGIPANNPVNGVGCAGASLVVMFCSFGGCCVWLTVLGATCELLVELAICTSVVFAIAVWVVEAVPVAGALADPLVAVDVVLGLFAAAATGINRVE